MEAAFRGFSAAAFAWFEGLERDNSRAYFAATRARYETEVRGALEDLLDELSAEFGGPPKVFRQHRDLRFARDRSPYKTRTYGVLAGDPNSATGLYAEVSARGLYAGTGYYRLARDQLERYRAAVADDGTGPELVAAATAVEAAALELAGESLRTAPRGVARDHPRIALLRRKALFAGARLRPGPGGIDADAARTHVRGTWRAAAPLNAWLDAHVGASELPPETRG
jgi:uncharacterized protein (TIGR02453 family)